MPIKFDFGRGSNYSSIFMLNLATVDLNAIKYEIIFMPSKLLVSKNQTTESDKILINWKFILFYREIDVYNAYTSDSYIIEEQDLQISDNDLEKIILTTHDNLSSFLKSECQWLKILQDLSYPLDDSFLVTSNMQKYLQSLRNIFT